MQINIFTFFVNPSIFFADCGIINEKITFSGTNFTKNDAIVLPWHTLLFNLDRSTQKIKFACGATIISTKYLITAGSCFEPNASLKSFKVVGAAVGKNFSENLNHDRPFITDVNTKIFGNLFFKILDVLSLLKFFSKFFKDLHSRFWHFLKQEISSS